MISIRCGLPQILNGSPWNRCRSPPLRPRTATTPLGAYSASPLCASIIEPPSGMSGYGPGGYISNDFSVKVTGVKRDLGFGGPFLGWSEGFTPKKTISWPLHVILLHLAAVL